MTAAIHTDAVHRAAPRIRAHTAAAAADRATLQDPIDILADWFPVVRTLLWDDPFKTVAEAFLANHPATAWSRSNMPERFPPYLRTYGSSSSIEYLADIADLECVYRVAKRSLGWSPASADLLSTLTAQQSKTLGIELHPSVSLLQSRFPIVSIWEGIRSNRYTLQRWTSELALVAKPAATVQVLCLSTDEHLFLTALARGRTIADAVSSANAINVEFGLTRALTFLAGINIAVGLHHVGEHAHRARAC